MPGPRTQNPQSLAIGLMEVRVGPSAANISTTTPVLTTSQSLGALSSASYTFNREYYEHWSDFPMIKDYVIPTQETQQITCEFEEMTPRNLAILQGIDPSSAGSSWTGEGYTVVSSDSGTYNTSDEIDGGADAEADTYRVIFLTATTYSVYSDKRGKLTGDQMGEGDTTATSVFTDGTTELLSIPSGFFTGTWAADDVFTFYMAKKGYDSVSSGEIKIGDLKAPDYLRVEGYYVFPNATNTMTVIFPRAQARTDNGEIAFAADTNAAVSITFEATPADSTMSGGNAAWDSMPLGRVVFA
jgi:hypothetical protein